MLERCDHGDDDDDDANEWRILLIIHDHVQYKGFIQCYLRMFCMSCNDDHDNDDGGGGDDNDGDDHDDDDDDDDDDNDEEYILQPDDDQWWFWRSATKMNDSVVITLRHWSRKDSCLWFDVLDF